MLTIPNFLNWRVLDLGVIGSLILLQLVCVASGGSRTSSVGLCGIALCWGSPTSGIMAQALPIEEPRVYAEVEIPEDPYVATREFNLIGKLSPFETSGVMRDFKVVTAKSIEAYDGPRCTLGDVIVPNNEVPESYYVPDEQLPRWQYLKGAKREPRVDKRTGHEYFYSEGSMAFPDLLENPSRTILTGEGGSGASRFKHIIQCEDGRYRRLVPDELDMLQGFPKGWTDTEMTDGRRAFCMGNALVVGVPHLIGKAIAKQAQLNGHE